MNVGIQEKYTTERSSTFAVAPIFVAYFNFLAERHIFRRNVVCGSATLRLRVAISSFVEKLFRDANVAVMLTSLEVKTIWVLRRLNKKTIFFQLAVRSNIKTSKEKKFLRI